MGQGERKYGTGRGPDIQIEALLFVKTQKCVITCPMQGLKKMLICRGVRTIVGLSQP